MLLRPKLKIDKRWDLHRPLHHNRTIPHTTNKDMPPPETKIEIRAVFFFCAACIEMTLPCTVVGPPYNLQRNPLVAIYNLAVKTTLHLILLSYLILYPTSADRSGVYNLAISKNWCEQAMPPQKRRKKESKKERKKRHHRLLGCQKVPKEGINRSIAVRTYSPAVV